MRNEFETLAASVKQMHIGIEVQLSHYPKGGMLLEARRADALFQIEFLPAYARFGVSRIADDTSPFGTHDFGFETFNEAKSKFIELLSAT